jgi:RNA polymerase sigma factor (sigma-70 family)
MDTRSVLERWPAGLRSRPVAVVADPWEVSLVERILAGDDSAMAEVYDQFSAVVHGVAVRLVGASRAADICQEVFVALWDHPERFDPARGNLRSFLVTIGRRRCIDHLRRHGRRESTEERATRARPAATPSVDEAAIALLAGQRVRDALAHLPAPQRAAIELAYFDGLTFRQVAAVTGASEGTAKSRIRLGLQRLALELRVHEEVGLA